MTRLVDKATVGDQRRLGSRRSSRQSNAKLKFSHGQDRALLLRLAARGRARVAQFLARAGFSAQFWREKPFSPKKRPFLLANVSGFSRGQLKRRS
jgi:hypothetical protein